MKKLICIVGVLLLLVGCGNQNPSEDLYSSDKVVEKEGDEVAEYRKISAEEAKEMMIEGNIILDVRTEEEFQEGHIPSATLLPLDDILAGTLTTLSDKDQTILVYCRSGNRSATASKALVDAGYSQVYDFGGIQDWPYDIEK